MNGRREPQTVQFVFRASPEEEIKRSVISTSSARFSLENLNKNISTEEDLEPEIISDPRSEYSSNVRCFDRDSDEPNKTYNIVTAKTPICVQTSKNESTVDAIRERKSGDFVGNESKAVESDTDVKSSRITVVPRPVQLLVKQERNVVDECDTLFGRRRRGEASLPVTDGVSSTGLSHGLSLRTSKPKTNPVLKDTFLRKHRNLDKIVPLSITRSDGARVSPENAIFSSATSYDFSQSHLSQDANSVIIRQDVDRSVALLHSGHKNASGLPAVVRLPVSQVSSKVSPSLTRILQSSNDLTKAIPVEAPEKFSVGEEKAFRVSMTDVVELDDAAEESGAGVTSFVRGQQMHRNTSCVGVEEKEIVLQRDWQANGTDGEDCWPDNCNQTERIIFASCNFKHKQLNRENILSSAKAKDHVENGSGLQENAVETAEEGQGVPSDDADRQTVSGTLSNVYTSPSAEDCYLIENTGKAREYGSRHVRSKAHWSEVVSPKRQSLNRVLGLEVGHADSQRNRTTMEDKAPEVICYDVTEKVHGASTREVDSAPRHRHHVTRFQEYKLPDELGSYRGHTHDQLEPSFGSPGDVDEVYYPYSNRNKPAKSNLPFEVGLKESNSYGIGNEKDLMDKQPEVFQKRNEVDLYRPDYNNYKTPNYNASPVLDAKQTTSYELKSDRKLKSILHKPNVKRDNVEYSHRDKNNNLRDSEKNHQHFLDSKEDLSANIPASNFRAQKKPEPSSLERNSVQQPLVDGSVKLEYYDINSDRELDSLIGRRRSKSLNDSEKFVEFVTPVKRDSVSCENLLGKEAAFEKRANERNSSVASATMKSLQLGEYPKRKSRYSAECLAKEYPDVRKEVFHEGQRFYLDQDTSSSKLKKPARGKSEMESGYWNGDIGEGDRISYGMLEKSKTNKSSSGKEHYQTQRNTQRRLAFPSSKGELIERDLWSARRKADASMQRLDCHDNDSSRDSSENDFVHVRSRPTTRNFLHHKNRSISGTNPKESKNASAQNRGTNVVWTKADEIESNQGAYNVPKAEVHWNQKRNHSLGCESKRNPQEDEERNSDSLSEISSVYYGRSPSYSFTDSDLDFRSAVADDGKKCVSYVSSSLATTDSYDDDDNDVMDGSLPGVQSMHEFKTTLKELSRYVLAGYKKNPAKSQKSLTERSKKKTMADLKIRRYHLDVEGGELVGLKENMRDFKRLSMIVHVISRLREMYPVVPMGRFQNQRAVNVSEFSPKLANLDPDKANDILGNAMQNQSLREMKETILDHVDADVNVRSQSGYAVLHRAAEEGDIEALRVLIEHDADLDISDRAGYPPVHHALRHYHYKAAMFLMDCGTDLMSYTSKRVQEFVKVKATAKQYLRQNLKTRL